MIVSELIDLLKTYDPNLPVCYEKYSEQVMLEPCDLKVRSMCVQREDGWVQDARPDKDCCDYLVFPGN